MAGESVWLLPRTVTGTDGHGNATATWPTGPGEPGAIEIEGAKVAPQTGLAGEAAIFDREAVVTHVKVLLPGGSPKPGAQDRMWVRGVVYAVFGEAGSWVNPWRQVETGIEVMVKRVEG